MKRKVVLHGPSTLIVSLPSKWAKKYGVRRGDELEVLELGDRLILSQDYNKKESKIIVDIKGLNERIAKWLISVAHKRGYTEIEVNFNSSKAIEFVQRLTKDVLLGFVIFNQSENSCTLKSVSYDNKDEFKRSLRKDFLITLSIMESFHNFLRSPSKQDLDSVLQLESSNNQLSNFCQRLILKYGIENEYNTFYYVIVWQLEKIGDKLRDIAQSINSNHRFKASKALLNIMAGLEANFRTYYELFYFMELAGINRLYDKLRDDSVLREIKTKEELIVANGLLEINNKISEIIPSAVAIRTKDIKDE